jgi:hypothetical protein
MTSLSAMTREFELAGMFLHQFLESPERNNLLERHMHGVRPGLDAENSCSFINELGVESNGDYCH